MLVCSQRDIDSFPWDRSLQRGMGIFYMQLVVDPSQYFIRRLPDGHFAIRTEPMNAGISRAATKWNSSFMNFDCAFGSK
jgi:hypothetical protein